jgi:uncharacterized protein YjiS (DUF1127 family)
MNALAPIIASVRRMWSLLAVWSERVAMRRQLEAMPERLLADIGLGQAQVAREVGRPFWRPFGECLAADGSSLRPPTSLGTPVPMPTVLRPVARLAGAIFPTLS